MMQGKHVAKILMTAMFLVGLIMSPEASKAQFYMGAHSGGLYTNLEGDVFGNNYKIGYSGGLILGIKFSETFSLQPEINASMKGFNQKYTEIDQLLANDTFIVTTSEFDNTLDLFYAEVPILFKLTFSLGNGIIPYRPKKGPIDIEVFAGPYVGYMLGATQTSSTHVIEEGYGYQGDSTGVTSEYTVAGGDFGLYELESDLNQDFIDTFFAGTGALTRPADIYTGLNKLDVGVTGGLGVSIEVGDRGKIHINGRYSMGLFTIDETAFNTVKINTENLFNETVGDEFTMEKKNITNVSMAAFVGYTYTFGD